MLTRKIGPALAAGCTVVCKSPGETPFTAAALAELADRAGIPAGVVNIITALHNTAEVGETITSSDTIRKVSFTGSTRVGQLLMKQSSDTLKKLSLVRYILHLPKKETDESHLRNSAATHPSSSLMTQI